jgi:hypothetical protein
MNVAYCIEHQHSVLVQQSLVGECHEYPVFTESGWEIDWCWFDKGWSVMEEPEYDSDWELNLVEPDEEEEMISWDEFNQAVLDGIELERWTDAENNAEVY